MENEERRALTRSIARTVVSYYDAIREAGGSGRGPVSDEMLDMLGTLGANHIVFHYEPPFPVPARPKQG